MMWSVIAGLKTEAKVKKKYTQHRETENSKEIVSQMKPPEKMQLCWHLNILTAGETHFRLPTTRTVR